MLELARVLLAAGPAGEPEAQHLLWADPNRRHPLFLPSSRLQVTPIDELPMNIIHQQILQSALDGAPRVGTSTRCPKLADITDFAGHRNGIQAPRPLCTRASKFPGVDRPVPKPGETVRVQGRLDRPNTGVIQHIRGGLVPRGGA